MAGFTINQILLLAGCIEFGFILGGIGMYIGIKNKDDADRKERWIKFIVYFAIVHIIIGAALAGKGIFSALILVILLFGFFEWISVSIKMQMRIKPKILPWLGGFLFLIFGFFTLQFSWNTSEQYCLYCYAVIAVLDAYSQITGQIFGKHKLASVTSPSKTVEGSIGGIICAFVTAFILKGIAGINWYQTVICALIICLFGIAGDLSASWYKRRCGIKDYSNFLPGQGGFIDRFISLIVPAPVLFLVYKIFFQG